MARDRASQDELIGSDLDVGSQNIELLLGQCMVGAEGDNVRAGWREYVSVIERVAAGHYHQGR